RHVNHVPRKSLEGFNSDTIQRLVRVYVRRLRQRGVDPLLRCSSQVRPDFENGVGRQSQVSLPSPDLRMPMLEPFGRARPMHNIGGNVCVPPIVDLRFGTRFLYGLNELAFILEITVA